MLEKWDAAVQDCENAVRRAGREQEAQQLLDKAKRMKHKSEQKDYYGKLPRDRWHLGCILPRVPAISLRTQEHDAEALELAALQEDEELSLTIMSGGRLDQQPIQVHDFAHLLNHSRGFVRLRCAVWASSDSLLHILARCGTSPSATKGRAERCSRERSWGLRAARRSWV